MSEEVSLYDLLNISIATPQKSAVNFGALHALLLAMLKQLDLREMKTRWRGFSPGYGSPDPVGVPVPAEEGQPDSELQKRTASPSDPAEQLNLLSRIQACEDGLSKSMGLILDLNEHNDHLKEQLEELRQQHEEAGDLLRTVTLVESCCHRVDVLEETVESLRDAGLPGDRESGAEKPGESGVDDQVTAAKGTSSPSSSNLTEPPQSSPPPSSHPNRHTVGPAAPSSPRNSEEKSQEEPDNTLAQTGVKGDSTAAGKPPTLESNSSKPSPEAVEALRSANKLQERLVQLEARVAALERGKVDQTQLAQLGELITNRGSHGDAFGNLMDQLNEQRALIDGLMSDRAKLDDLRQTLEETILSFTSQLSTGLKDEAVQGESDSQELRQRSERSDLNARTGNTGEEFGLLFERYEQLQEAVNRLIQQSGGRAELLQDRESVQQAILQLQADCERLNETTEVLQEDNRQKQRHIEELYKTTEELEVNKADKQMVESEIKADKSALEGKVSRLQFDSVTEQLSLMFHELLNKVTHQEQDWHKLMAELSTEMQCKLNRIELDSVKKQLEDRWRSIHEKLQAQAAPESDDAAAIRKQLVERFHCLSCDRPVVKHTPGPKRISELADYSHLAASRSCGGSHYANAAGGQRRSGVQHTKHHGQCEADGAVQSEEVDIVGLDGRIYKGRIYKGPLNVPTFSNTETKLPTIPSKDGECKNKDKAKPAASPEVGHSAPLHQPCSPRSAPSSRSASSCSGRDWPVSALGCASQSSITQASAAAESTVAPQSSEPPDL
ncbi:glutamine-rich protein 2 isoform X2 [Archocentrus centrarchus]|uniref:glutamine-rich protein 2 isoform X2 n=1 Tax=Archocentrus centrarchus TaxID=63155 RepID=UPI0011E9C7A3|nr:glutamine-rich protein 2-like isoform X2 [Archocentrus centrarchus]